MDMGREDMIGIGFAFAGAMVGTFVAAPLLAPPALGTLIGAASGWVMAGYVMSRIQRIEQDRMQTVTQAESATRDAEFARQLFDADTTGPK